MLFKCVIIILPNTNLWQVSLLTLAFSSTRYIVDKKYVAAPTVSSHCYWMNSSSKVRSNEYACTLVYTVSLAFIILSESLHWRFHKINLETIQFAACILIVKLQGKQHSFAKHVVRICSELALWPVPADLKLHWLVTQCNYPSIKS